MKLKELIENLKEIASNSERLNQDVVICDGIVVFDIIGLRTDKKHIEILL